MIFHEYVIIILILLRSYMGNVDKTIRWIIEVYYISNIGIWKIGGERGENFSK